MRQFRTSLLNLDPPEHTRIRRLVSGVFTARRVAGLRSQVELVTTELVEGLAGEPDFISAFAFPLPIAVIGELLGVPRADQRPFQQLVRDWMFVLDAYTPEILARADDAANEIRSYLAGLTAERRRRPREDLLSALAAPEAAGERLSEDDVLTTAALLFSAGFETTTHLLGNGSRPNRERCRRPWAFVVSQDSANRMPSARQHQSPISRVRKTPHALLP